MTYVQAQRDGLVENRPYDQRMGRPLTRPRPPQGEHLAYLRKQAGLSQAALAELISEPQSTIAKWELSPKPPRADAIPKLAKALSVSVEEILNAESPKPKKRGPAGRAEQLFSQVSRLPKRDQERVLEMVSIFLEQHRRAG